MKSLPRLIARPAPPPVQTTILYQPIHTVSVAKGQNEAEIWKSLQPLLREAGGRWSVTDDRKGIHAVFQFKGFERTWVSNTVKISLDFWVPIGEQLEVGLIRLDAKEFMSAVADQCKLENHHPQWTNVRCRPILLFEIPSP